MVGRLLIIVDTGYWLELFKVPGKFNEKAHNEIIKRFQKAIKQNARFYWPLPSVYETANLMAQVANGNHRTALVKKLYDKIAESFEPNSILTITPACECEQQKLLAFLGEFSNTYVPQKVGLVDAAIIYEARRLKNKNNQVHIWTVDQDVKSHEPDAEKNPFVGR
jgi:predicted nucleic acid-binding protein